jgi:hypothetical protein
VPVLPVVLALFTLGGMIAGAGIVITAGFFLAIGTMSLPEGPARHSSIVLPIGIAIDLAAVALFVFFVRKIHRDRSLALELRRRAGRFFVIGFFLGCGLACLLEGICFTAAGVSS